MANWLLDYIEMTEYIPTEFRDQSFLMRELDLKVSIAMNELEQEIKDFFSKIDKLSPEEKQEQYEALLKKCDSASKTASDKVRMADRLHDLVEKSMRLLDQGLEKLKEELLEGDKAYIVEDLEKRSQELDDQMRQQHEALLKQQNNKCKDLKTQPKGQCNSNNVNNHNNHHSHHQHHRHSQAHHHSNHNHSQQTNNPVQRVRNNSNISAHNTTGKQKKRERKRLNSAMTIFNRNSRTDDDSTNQTIVSSPSTPDYLVGLQSSNSNSLNDVSGGDNSGLTLKGMIASKKNFNIINDKNNGLSNDNPSIKARQPILTAIDAAHAVSPNATNSDKLVLFSSNSNGDNLNNSIYYADKTQNQQTAPANIKASNNNHNQSQLSGHLVTTPEFDTGQGALLNCTDSQMLHKSHFDGKNHNDIHLNDKTHGTSATFSTLPLAARHDPIMLAASQAINATQNMTQGRRTSSLKASYAAVNSGRLQPAQNQPMFEQGTALKPDPIYCQCRGAIHDPMMIACDNAKCEYKWFHFQCVGITDPPEGEWYCDDCRIIQRSLNHATNFAKQHKTGGVTSSHQFNDKTG